MGRCAVENELREVHSLPTSGTIKDLKERLARAEQKKWLPPKPGKQKDAQETTKSNAGLTEDFLLLSSVNSNNRFHLNKSSDQDQDQNTQENGTQELNCQERCST